MASGNAPTSARSAKSRHRYLAPDPERLRRGGGTDTRAPQTLVIFATCSPTLRIRASSDIAGEG